MGRASKVDVETLRRVAHQILGAQFSDARLERFAVQLGGLLEETGRLDELDLTGVEPARVFTNRGQ